MNSEGSPRTFIDYSRDIVDTEGSQGNVWKMLLGSIDKTFDEGDEDEDEVDGEDED